VTLALTDLIYWPLQARWLTYLPSCQIVNAGVEGDDPRSPERGLPPCAHLELHLGEEALQVVRNFVDVTGITR
jgi:hypothetical protein